VKGGDSTATLAPSDKASTKTKPITRMSLSLIWGFLVAQRRQANPDRLQIALWLRARSTRRPEPVDSTPRLIEDVRRDWGACREGVLEGTIQPIVVFAPRLGRWPHIEMVRPVFDGFHSISISAAGANSLARDEVTIG
jgi:hypothetical protein